MAQQSGANAVILIATETVFKTSPGSPTGAHILPFVSESVRLNRNLVSSNTIRSDRNPQAPARGNMDVSGDINFELSPQYGLLFKHIFGGYAVVAASPCYQHTYKIAALPVGLTMEKQFTDLASAKYFLYNGCKINGFRMSGATEGMINSSVSVVGAKETGGAATFESSPTDNGHTPFDGFEGSISQGGAPLGTVTAYEIALENGLDANTYVVDGTGERYSIPDGRAKVTGKITVLFDSTTLYDLAVAHTETSLAIALSKGTGDGTTGNELMTFSMDELIFRPQAPVIQGPTGLLVELPFEAYYNNDADESALRMVLLSPLATF
jgi:hypothetical protein